MFSKMELSSYLFNESIHTSRKSLCIVKIYSCENYLTLTSFRLLHIQYEPSYAWRQLVNVIEKGAKTTTENSFNARQEQLNNPHVETKIWITRELNRKQRNNNASTYPNRSNLFRKSSIILNRLNTPDTIEVA